MYRYLIFRGLSLVLGLTFIYVIFLSPFEISINNALFILGGSFFIIYGVRPSLVLKIFKLNPDEDVLEETKKDFKIISDFWRSKKD